MVSAQQLLTAAPKRRSIRSLRQQYALYVDDRVEQYKNSISRDELFRLGDEALVERPEQEQFLLTELLAETIVNDLIKRRLGLPSFETWRKKHPKLRAAQKDATHWGLDPTHLVAGLAPRIEPDDSVLVVGAGAEACAYLLAAHDAVVTFLDRDFGVVERAEARVAAESLSSTFDAICVQFGRWLPCIEGNFVLVVVDAGTLATLSPGERRILLNELQTLTASGGLHALVPDSLGTGPEGFAGHYAAWERETLPPTGRRQRGAAPPRGALFVKTGAAMAERENARA
jgi:hypothetical protein